MSQVSEQTMDNMSTEVINKIEMVSRLVKTKEEIQNYINYLKRIILLLSNCIKNKVDCVKNFSKVESNLSILKGYLSRFKMFKRKKNLEQCNKSLVWQDVDSCFQGRIKTGVITNLKVKEPKLFLEQAFKSFSRKIKQELQKSLLKVNVIFSGMFIKPQTGERSFKFFRTKNEIIDRNSDLKEWYQRHVIGIILVKLEEFQERDSGWALYEIIHLKVNINTYNPITGGISTFIDVPKFLKNTKSLINVRNNDEFCFLWSVVCALYPANDNKHCNRLSSYPHFSKVLKYEGIHFPIGLKDIPKFEMMNGLSINIFILDKREVVPLLLSKTHYTPCINLLMLSCMEYNEDDDEYDYEFEKTKTLFHFVCIYKRSFPFTK